jgi:predicted dehydrogenase
MTLDRRSFLAQASSGLAAFALSPDLEAFFPRLPADMVIKVGVIGTGKRGNSALEELATMDGVQIVSIADVDPGRRNRGKRRAPEAAIYESGTALLEAGGIDAVIIATPTDRHRALVERAVELKLPVYCEAPIAHTIEDAQAIAVAANTEGAFVTAGYTANTNPVYRRARDVYKSGSLRNLVSLRCHSRQKLSWREAAPTPEREKSLSWRLNPKRCAGLGGELGSHQIHTMRWFTGKSPWSVRGWGGIRHWQNGSSMPDTVQLEFGWDADLRLQQEITLASSIGGESLEISGTHGTARLAGRHAWLFKESDSATQGWEVYAHKETFHQDQGYVLLANATKLAAQGKLQAGMGLPHTEQYYALHAFVSAAMAEDGQPACPIPEALTSTVAGIQSNEAITTGGEILLGFVG